ncbi:MAG: PEP-CTERM sorting domain-containing protein [Gemmatales bacterium]
MKQALRTTSCMIVLLMGSLTVHAQTGLLIDPSTLTNTGLTGDDSSITRTLPTTGTFNFYGVTRTTVDISTNGNLNFSSNTTFSNGTFPTAVTRIAPFWDDLITTGTPPASAILDNQGDVTNPYYAVTWQNISNFGSNPAARYTFQAVWFNGPLTIGTFNFQAGDLAFDYTNMSTFLQGGNATVGLDQGNSSGFNPVPGSADGFITDLSLLPIDNEQFILFRENQAGGYDVSIQSLAAVPEPSTVIMTGAGLGAIVLGVRRHRRRKLKRRTSQQPVQAASAN